MFLTSDLRTYESTGKSTKNRPQRSVLKFRSALCACAAFVTHRDKSLCYSLWQGHLCNIRVDFIHEILLFGKNIKVFIDTQS